MAALPKSLATLAAKKTEAEAWQLIKLRLAVPGVPLVKGQYFQCDYSWTSEHGTLLDVYVTATDKVLLTDLSVVWNERVLERPKGGWYAITGIHQGSLFLRGPDGHLGRMRGPFKAEFNNLPSRGPHAQLCLFFTVVKNRN
jgi:hypothetical protein